MMEEYNIEGRNPVYEALKAKSKINKIFVEENKLSDDRIKKIIKLAESKNIPVMRREFINNISETKRHQGVIAVAKRENLKLKDIKDPKLVVVVTDSDYDSNLGSVIRSSEAAGADCVVIPRSKKITSHVIKSSAGAIEHIPVLKENIFTALKHFRDNGLIVYALSEKAKTSLFEAKLDMPIVIIVGKEDTGLNESIKKYVDEFLRIAMTGSMSSLNMAASTSIALFETVRQKR